MHEVLLILLSCHGKLDCGKRIMLHYNCRRNMVLCFLPLAFLVYVKYNGVHHIFGTARSSESLQRTKDVCPYVLNGSHYNSSSPWTPDTCNLMDYSPHVVSRCCHGWKGYKDREKHDWLEVNKTCGQILAIVVGDSRMRQLFSSLVQFGLHKPKIYLQPHNKAFVFGHLRFQLGRKMHHDFYAISESEGLCTLFKWDPYLDTSHRLLTRVMKLPKASRPLLLVIGSGLWNLAFLKNAIVGIDQLKHSISSLLPLLNKLANETTQIVWHLQQDVNEKYLSTLRYNNTHVQWENDEVRRLLLGSKVHVMDSHLAASREILLKCLEGKLPHKDMNWMCDNNVHSGYVVVDHCAQILYNYMCNSQLDISDRNYCSNLKR